MRPEHPSDPERQTLQLPSGPVSYTDKGQGPALIACHGCPGSVRDWRWMGPVLEEGVRLIRLDLPGFGDTPLATWPDASNGGRARFVLAVADALGVGRFGVMAHSAGGPMSLELAAHHPERISGLALMGVPGLRPHRPIREHPEVHSMTRMLAIPIFRPLMTWFLRRGFETSGFPKGLPGDSIRQAMYVVGAFDFDRQTSNARAVHVPNLLAWTDDDPFIDKEISEELAAALPTGVRLPFPDGGHYLQKTHATEISEAIVALLRSAAPPTAATGSPAPAG